MGSCFVFCRGLLCHFAISCAWVVHGVFFPLLICKRSFSISGEHRTARSGWFGRRHGGALVPIAAPVGVRNRGRTSSQNEASCCFTGTCCSRLFRRHASYLVGVSNLAA